MKKEYAHNPILPEQYFVPDVEARVGADGRLYLYGSLDRIGVPDWCSDEHRVFSTDDMIHWVDHGLSFSLKDQAQWVRHEGYTPMLYAPDAIYRNGTYYLYYCVSDSRCGVATSKTPEGPFTDVGQIEYVDGIDPSVFIDDDGQAYLYWGGQDRVRVAKLKDNMVEIDPTTITQPLTVAEHGFHEGSSVRKIDGLYYYIYTDTHRRDEKHTWGRATCMGYSVSDNPMHGFQYKGVIIDNIGCDPGSWNNHGSLVQYKGEWYIFYHRSTHGFEYSRHVCVEKVTIKDGEIREVPMTTSGAGDSIPASETIPASWACRLGGHARITKSDDPSLPMMLAEMWPGDSASFAILSFEGETKLRTRVKVEGPCQITVWIDGENMGLAEKGESDLVTVPLRHPVEGKHEVKVMIDGVFDAASMYEIAFSQ